MDKAELSAAEVRREAERQATQDWNEAIKPLWKIYMVALEKAKQDWEQAIIEVDSWSGK